LLEVQSVDVFYGEFQAVSHISLRVEEGEIVAIIGANGAGKSTILLALMGLQGCRKGRVTFQDQDITHMPAFRRARLT
jgi:branched-chain amino acid transport system ATP-binding protein